MHGATIFLQFDNLVCLLLALLQIYKTLGLLSSPYFWHHWWRAAPAVALRVVAFPLAWRRRRLVRAAAAAVVWRLVAVASFVPF